MYDSTSLVCLKLEVEGTEVREKQRINSKGITES